MSRPSQPPVLSADMLLVAYARGWFPMAHTDGTLYWHDPDPRAVFHLADLRPDRDTRRMRDRGTCTVAHNTAFLEVMRACAERDPTWISGEMVEAYSELHHMGHAMSVEVWSDGTLVGGIYGVTLGAAFFGESMFSRQANAGKLAFHALVDRLKGAGCLLFDSQYINPFTRQLGAIEIPRTRFRRELARALEAPTLRFSS
jgi:leucyl/phenylalanyl-tRNA--protein transferase